MTYFSTAELRALPDMDDEDRFPDARLEAAHDWIASIIRRECDTSFTLEEVTETISGNGCGGLRVSDPYIVGVLEATVDGVAWSEDDATALIIQYGFVYQPSDAAWSYASRQNITLTYTAGYSTEPPADLKEAALRAARHWLLTMDGWSGVDERSTSLTNEFGNVNLSTPGEDRPTGLPMVDSTIMAWARKVRVPSVS